jgi:dipeptidyl aminopeptidase/acylaminoacyl peptidase
MILNRKLVEHTEIQKKILKSGWGDSSIENSVVERLSYISDGLNVNGYYAYPKDISKKYPCMIWCRGGIGNAGALDDFYAQGILGQLASWGYVVFESQYRGNVGGEGSDDFGGDDLNDVINLVPLADELEFADTNNWGIEGWSRGGLMTYLTLTKSDIFKVAISTGGITNLQCTLNEGNFMKKLFNLNHLNLDEEYCFNRTILNSVDKYSKTTPTLLIHGTDDERVPAHHSLDLSYKFLEYGIEHKLVLFENGDHFLRDHKKEIDELRKNWLNKYLK